MAMASGPVVAMTEMTGGEELAEAERADAAPLLRPRPRISPAAAYWGLFVIVLATFMTFCVESTISFRSCSTS